MVRKGNDTTDDNLWNLHTNEDGLNHWREIMPPIGKPLVPAKSQWSTGRGCPKCAGQLMVFEYRTEVDEALQDNMVLQCKKCRRIWHDPDLQPVGVYSRDPNDESKFVDDTTQIDNPLFRDIPESDIIKWMQARENEKIRKGEW